MPRNIHVSQALTDFATTYRNGNYVAPHLCPDIPVDHWKDKFYQLRRADVLTPLDDVIGPRAEPSEIDYEQDEGMYECVDRGNVTYVDWREQKDADPVLQIQRRKIALVMNNLQLNRERRVAGALQTNTNYAASNRIDAVNAWSDSTNGNPIKNLQEARAAIAPGVETSTKLVAVCALELWHEAQRHPQLLGLLGSDDRGLVRKEAFRDFFELDEFYVSDAQHNTANRGAAASLARIWGTDKFVMVRLPTSIPSPDSSIFSGRFVVQQGGKSANEAVESGELDNVIVTEWLEPKRGAGEGSIGTKVTLSESDPVILQNDMGAIIFNA